MAGMGDPPGPSIPRYGERSLAELTPSLLGALGVEGFEDRLGLGPVKGFCLLLIDGLGWRQIRDHAAVAPFLASAAEATEPLTAGFPATTAASLGSLATGVPPGQHGLVGYTFAVAGHDRPMNVLLWELYGTGPHVDLRQELVPEEFQPLPTALERAAQAGVAVIRIGPAPHEQSPLTRAILRGGPYRGAYWASEVRDAVAEGLRTPGRPAVYAYHPDLDVAGHSTGVGSERWTAQLAAFDTMVEDIASALPEDCLLAVTGDHGMVNLEDGQKVDADEEPGLLDGVRMLGGEARARHVYARPGAASDVLAAWRERLGHGMWIVPREEAIDAGWFGPVVADGVRPRIGDVVAAARGPIGVVQRSVDAMQAGLVGHHGSMTEAEQLVPLLLYLG
jgi:type I phosphodiesterase/nucleotide pyrophosphatase